MSTSVASLSNNFFPSAENGFTTTTSGSVASGATTVGLNSVAGYSNGEIAVFVIDPTDATKKQSFTGVIDTAGVQVTSVVWTAGTNQTHALGATVVDYATATHISMMSKGILVDHSQAGAHEIATNYDPSNPTLETQKWAGVSSAVNEITATNAATGNGPNVSATGGDTNIDLLLTGKGTGSARHNGPYDGWVSAGETLTYASATTFTTASAALAGTLAVGDKIKLTQTTVKYFYVTGISGTTITITGGSDYTLANAAITLPYYSHETTPFGFPDYFNWTPTWASDGTQPAIVNGTYVANFAMHGKTVVARMKVTFGSSTTFGTGVYTWTLPVTSGETSSAFIPVGTWTSTGVFMGLTTVSSSTTVFGGIYHSINTSGAANAPIGQLAPTTWANTNSIDFRLTYKAA